MKDNAWYISMDAKLKKARLELQGWALVNEMGIISAKFERNTKNPIGMMSALMESYSIMNYRAREISHIKKGGQNKRKVPTEFVINTPFFSKNPESEFIFNQRINNYKPITNAESDRTKNHLDSLRAALRSSGKTP